MISRGPISKFPVAAALFAAAAAAGDTIGATNYTVGTHQAALADSQPQPQVWGTHPSLIPAAVATATPRPFFVPQGAYDNVQPSIWGPQPTTASTVIVRPVVTQQQIYDDVQAILWGLNPPPTPGRPFFVSQQPYSDVQPSVWGPQPDPIAAPQAIGRPFLALQQPYDDLQAALWGPQPTTASSVFTRPVIAAQEHAENGYGKVWGTPQAVVAGTDVIGATNFEVGTHWDFYGNGYGIRLGKFPVVEVFGTDTAIGVTRVSAQEWRQEGTTKVWGTPPASVAAPEAPITRFRFAAQEWRENPQAKVWGTKPFDQFQAITRYFEIAQDSTEQWGGEIWGTPPLYAVQAPVVTEFIAPRQDVPEQWGGAVWGQQPPSNDVTPVFRTNVQQSTEQWAGEVWGYTTPFVAGTDVAITKFLFSYQPDYQPVAYGFSFPISADLIPPPVVVTPPEVTPAGRKKRTPRYTVEIDGHEFEVPSYEAAVDLLTKAKGAAQTHADSIARRIEKRIRRRGKIGNAEVQVPAISTPDLALKDVVASFKHQIRDVYTQATQNAELRELLRQKFRDEDEDDVETLLLH